MNWVKACVSDANCVEVAAEGGRMLLRDSKNPDGPVIEFSPDEWREFVKAAAEWDGREVRLDAPDRVVTVWRVPDSTPGGIVCVVDRRLRHLHVTEPEWDAFVAGLRAGQFDKLVTR